MVQFEPIDFGIFIAFILPGSIGVYGLRYISPRINELWTALEHGQIVLGPLVLLALSALAVGLIVSSLRVVFLEPVFHCFFGVHPVNVKYEKLADPGRLEFFKEMVKNVYRYEQFYGNTFLALLFCSTIRYLVANAPVRQTRGDQAVFGTIVLALFTLFLAGRKSLEDVYRSIREITH